MVAKYFLIIRTTLVAACTIPLLSCSTAFSKYPTKEPREVGQTVERLRKEALGGLTVKPDSTREVFGDACGEEWDKKEEVAPQKNDPWKVSHNLFRFRTDVTITIKSPYDAPPIYRAIKEHLQEIGGWNIQEQFSANGFPGGVSGEKSGIYLHAFNSLDKNRNSLLRVTLDSKCYKHPNAQ